MAPDKTREHMRCPCCGRLAILPSGSTLPAAFRADHATDVAIQTFTGKGQGAGFAWESRDLRSDEFAALTDVVSSIAARLRGTEIGDVDEAGGDLSSVSSVKLKALHKKAIEREAQIARARGVPPLGEAIEPPSVAKLRKKRERDRETIRLAAEHIDQLERENAELRRALGAV